MTLLTCSLCGHGACKGHSDKEWASALWKLIAANPDKEMLRVFLQQYRVGLLIREANRDLKGLV